MLQSVHTLLVNSEMDRYDSTIQLHIRWYVSKHHIRDIGCGVRSKLAALPVASPPDTEDLPAEIWNQHS